MTTNTICLKIYAGSEGSEYIIHTNGDVNITLISNGGIDSEVDVDVQSFGFNRPEQLVADLLNQGYEIEWPV